MTKKRSGTIKKGSGSAEHADQPEHKEVDILVDRLLEYKSITKGLVAYYEGIAKLETFAAVELQKIGGHLPVPLREGNQFMTEGGWQTVLENTRERTRAISDHHNALAHGITHGTLHDLNKVKDNIKEFIEELSEKPSRLATEVGKSRAESTRIITQLAEAITLSKVNPLDLAANDDPVLLHRQINEQLKSQVKLENLLTMMIIEYQKKCFELEKRINNDIQAAVQEFESSRSIFAKLISQEWQTIHAGVTGIDPELEWKEFSKRSDHLIPDDFPMRDLDNITFPGNNDETTKPITSGILERKKRFTRHYKEGYYVLTPSGYLHEFKSSDLSKHPQPEVSIFLPNCSLGPPAPADAKTFKWHIEGSKHTGGSQNSGSLTKMRKSLYIGRKEVAFSFKCRTHAEMMRWWELMKQTAPHSTAVADKSPSATPGLLRQTITHDNGSSADEEAGGSSEEEEPALSPDDHSTGPKTPVGVQNFGARVVSPTAESDNNVPLHAGDHNAHDLDATKEKTYPPLHQQEANSTTPH